MENERKPYSTEKFLIREIQGEHKQETEIRANLALCRLETEISLLQTRALRYQETFQSIDTAMMAEISEKSSGKIEEKLRAIWNQDTKREEEKSKDIWTKQQGWFDKYEEEYGEMSIMKMKPKKIGKQKNDEHVKTAKQNGKERIYKFRTNC